MSKARECSSKWYRHVVWAGALAALACGGDASSPKADGGKPKASAGKSNEDGSKADGGKVDAAEAGAADGKAGAEGGAAGADAADASAADAGAAEAGAAEAGAAEAGAAEAGAAEAGAAEAGAAEAGAAEAGAAEAGAADAGAAEAGAAEAGAAEAGAAEAGAAEAGAAEAGAAEAGEDAGPDPKALLNEAKNKKTDDERAKAALDEAEAAGAKPKDVAKAAHARGKKLFATPDRAKVFYELALEKYAKLPDPAFELAKMSANAGDLDEAKTWLEETKKRGGKKLLSQIDFDPSWEVLKDDPDVRALID